jgi:hypothetical protein
MYLCCDLATSIGPKRSVWIHMLGCSDIGSSASSSFSLLAFEASFGVLKDV